MPIAYSLQPIPNGREVLRMVSQGAVTKSDAEGFMTLTLPGGPHAGRSLLIVVGRTTEVSSDARRVFTAPRDDASPRPPAAIVTPDRALRVLLNFMTRVSGGAANTRFFTSEPEAIAWLDDPRVEPQDQKGGRADA